MVHTGHTGAEVGAFYDMTSDAFGIVFEGTIHAGYWGGGAATFPQAQRDLTDLVLDGCRVPDGGRVLDAGCGHGGPAAHTAERCGGSVVGITVSAVQVATAAAMAAKNGLADRVDFQVADMTTMPFPDESFDAAYAIESVFHVVDKAAAFAEIHRVLRPGASFAMADYYLTDDMSEEDRETAHGMLFASPLRPLGEIGELVTGAGFTAVRARDITADVRASAAHMNDAVSQRHDALVAATGEEMTTIMAEAVRQYNRICVEGQGYAVLEARKPG